MLTPLMRSRIANILVVTAVLVCLVAAKVSDSENGTFQEILKTYTFIADFSQKPEVRQNSDEIFWKYQYLIDSPSFPLEPKFTNFDRELPKSPGEGRPLQHLNQARISIINGDYEGAKGILLAARNRFGTSYALHRRADYMTAYTFLGLAFQKYELANKNWSDTTITFDLDNASTFLNWALIVKRDDIDPLVEDATPKGLYNMAAIYFLKKRFAGSFGAASTGINYLRKTGRNEYRAQFHRLLAEVYIKNRNYLQATQELDLGIRLDPDPKLAPKMFGRIADIYFDLNNYELADDLYSLASKIDREKGYVDPSQHILRGETLFWLGKFAEAQKVIDYGLHSSLGVSSLSTLPPGYASLGLLRIADSFLALKNFKKAALSYFQVEHQFPNSYAAKVASVRRACLELPGYQGNNVSHARKLLDEVRKDPNGLPKEAVELAWACEVESYTERERTPMMLARVREFALAHSGSRFLQRFVSPVAEVQRSKINEYIDAGKIYETISFYETNKELLFKSVESYVARALFESYVDTFQSIKAAEFLPAFEASPDSDKKWIYLALAATELAEHFHDAKWKSKNREISVLLMKRSWSDSAQGILEPVIGRFIISESGNLHLPWLTRFIDFSRYSDVASLCKTAYPLLVRVSDQEPVSGSISVPVSKRINAIIEKHYQELSNSQPDCLAAFFDLEHRSNPSMNDYLEVMSRRLKWKPSPSLLQQFWDTAEEVRGKQESNFANNYYEYIKKNAPKDSKLAKFASERLDNRRSEMENLWQK